MIRFEFRFATPSQNTWQRMHFGRQAKIKASIQFQIRQQLNELGLWGVHAPTTKRRLTVRRYSVGRLDRGNFIGGCKALLDALRDEGVIRDDSEQWLDDHYEQHKGERGQPRTVVEVEDIAP